MLSSIAAHRNVRATPPSMTHYLRSANLTHLRFVCVNIFLLFLRFRPVRISENSCEFVSRLLADPIRVIRVIRGSSVFDSRPSSVKIVNILSISVSCGFFVSFVSFV